MIEEILLSESMNGVNKMVKTIECKKVNEAIEGEREFYVSANIGFHVTAKNANEAYDKAEEEIKDIAEYYDIPRIDDEHGRPVIQN